MSIYERNDSSRKSENRAKDLYVKYINLAQARVREIYKQLYFYKYILIIKS